MIEVKSGGIRYDDSGWDQMNSITREEKQMMKEN